MEITEKLNYKQIWDGSYIPLDEDDNRYIKSFNLEQADEYIKFFEEFGFVVIRDVLSPEQCKNTVDEIWQIVKEYLPDADREKPSTLNSWFGIEAEGILPMDPIFTKNAIENRINEKIYNVCSEILGTKDLLVNHDRYGLFRPTKGVKEGEQIKNYSDYRTKRNVHLDMNPWGFLQAEQEQYSIKCLERLKYKSDSEFIDENNHCFSIFTGSDKKEVSEITEEDLIKTSRKYIQGLINLADNFEEDGGFQVVPKFHKNFIKWTGENKSLINKFGLRDNFIWLPMNLHIQNQTIRVTARAGSIVIWSQLVAHGSRPNESSNYRFAQFFKMYPKHFLSDNVRELRKIALMKNINCFNELNITDTGKQLLDLFNN